MMVVVGCILIPVFDDIVEDQVIAVSVLVRRFSIK